MQVIDVLLVEDNASDAQHVAEMLAFARAPQFKITTVGCLSDACAQLRDRTFDVVLLDLGLPDAAGLDSFTRLRSDAPGIAIVVLSGMADEQLAISTVEAGAQDYLVKTRGDGDALQRSIRYAIARRQADEAQRQLAAIVESSADAIIANDRDGKIVSWNPGAERLYGYCAEEVIGRPDSILIPLERADEGRMILQAVLAGRHVDSYETRRLRTDGAQVDVSLTVSPITDASGIVIGASAIARDISEQKRLESELQHRADHDHLTGLLNRSRFEHELGHHLALARRYGSGGALLSLDLDAFKAVNDAHGHAAGDELLRSVARLLSDRVRATDFVARLGGDEVAILLPQADRDGALALADSLLNAIRKCVVPVGQETAASTVSIGVALIDDHADSPDSANSANTLLVRADRAMYAAKQAGGDQVACLDDVASGRGNRAAPEPSSG